MGPRRATVERGTWRLLQTGTASGPCEPLSPGSVRARRAGARCL